VTTPPQDPGPGSLTPPSGPYPSALAPVPPTQPSRSWEAVYGQPTQRPDDAAEARRTAGTAMGWAIGAAVAAGVAVVGALVAVLLSVGAIGGALDDPGSWEPLRGQVVGLSDGAALSGDRLEHVLVDLQRDWGAEDVQISCPDTSSVAVSTVVVCHGRIDDYEWTGAVLFADSAGTFVVAEF
jgi:hypothetical protein